MHSASSYEYVFKCDNNSCQSLIFVNNINKDVNDLEVGKDLNAILFIYYFVDKKFVAEDNIDLFNYVNDKCGFAWLFLYHCTCLDLVYYECEYCDNRDFRAYDDER